jgi:hypothetical protein
MPSSSYDSGSIATGLRLTDKTPNAKFLRLVYINLHEVYRFDLLIKGFNRYLDITKFEKEKMEVVKRTLERANPFGLITKILREKLQLEIHPRHFFTEDSYPITNFDELASMEDNSVIYVTVKPAFRHLYTEQMRENERKRPGKDKPRTWDHMANKRIQSDIKLMSANL